MAKTVFSKNDLSDLVSGKGPFIEASDNGKGATQASAKSQSPGSGNQPQGWTDLDQGTSAFSGKTDSK